ncbi:hypothetical protein BDZ97DRAFT_1805983 [Flammula alnicola]|nr:hypothetical protein BDZ97DRAFT_1805983 [Flammula alnicola]
MTSPCDEGVLKTTPRTVRPPKKPSPLTKGVYKMAPLQGQLPETTGVPECSETLFHCPCCPKSQKSTPDRGMVQKLQMEDDVVDISRSIQSAPVRAIRRLPVVPSSSSSSSRSYSPSPSMSPRPPFSAPASFSETPRPQSPRAMRPLPCPRSLAIGSPHTRAKQDDLEVSPPTERQRVMKPLPKALKFLKVPWTKRTLDTLPAIGTGSGVPGSPGWESIVFIGDQMSSRFSDDGDPEDDIPLPPEEDSGISAPWNFQHHIHVDEGRNSCQPNPIRRV